MCKKLFVNICLVMCLLLGMIPEKVVASEEIGTVSMSIDLNEVEVGDSIVVYEDKETGEKFVVDVLSVKTTRDFVGSDNWSSGNIPSYTVTLYPHKYVDYMLYEEIGFYVTYDGANQKILDTYGETIKCEKGVISDVNSRIISAVPTASVPAKAQMNWVVSGYNSLGKPNTSRSCYLRMEINNNNQMRGVWSINGLS